MSTKAEAPLESIFLYQAVAHASPYPMALFQGADHALKYANPAFSQLAELEQSSLLGRTVAECLPRCPGCIALLSRVSESGHAEQHTEQGYAEFWSYAAWPIASPINRPVLMMLLITQTSELHRTATMVNEALVVSAVEQQEIAEVTEASAKVMSNTVVRQEQELDRSKEELRLLALQLLEAQEDERRRIARELHDSFSQQLASLGMQIFHLEQEISPDARHRLLGEMQSQLVGLANDVRSLSHRLHPPTLEDLGLVTSLRALHEEFETIHSIPIRFLAQELMAPIPLRTATALYRIVQESLWNIIKHAGQDVLVTVELCQVLNDLVLCVKDTGAGFDPQRTRVKGGLGLISMQERAQLVSGTLTIESAPGQGTKVRVCVPLGTSPQLPTSAS